MKILVTGGAGFIGSNLCEELVKNENNEIYSLDNYFTGTTLNHIDHVNYIKGDTAQIEKLFFVHDIIFNLVLYITFVKTGYIQKMLPN